MIQDHNLSFPRAVLFDWDNTLVDSAQGTHHALNHVLDSFGHQPMSYEEFLRHPPLAIERFFALIVDEALVPQACQIYNQHMQNHTITAFEHSHALVQWLGQGHVSTGIVSNKEGEKLRQEIQFLGWDRHFTQAIGAKDTSDTKPSPIPLLHALRGLDIEPAQDVWFVGDSIVDIHCAHQAGCRPVLLASGQPPSAYQGLQVGDASVLLTLLQGLHTASIA
jgi:phosphoglycolate phosphatase